MAEKNSTLEESGAPLENSFSETYRHERHKRLRELARQQGVKPIQSIRDIEGDFWPENESVDDFLDLVRSIRHQDHISSRTSE
jgi:hypothetical protein